MFEFAMEHWGVVFVLCWVSIWMIGQVISRTLRTIMVASRGWPPAHLDADGDWRHKPDASE